MARKDTVDLRLLKEALTATATKRGSLSATNNCRKVMEQVASDSAMLIHWSSYAKRYPYVGDLSLQDTCRIVTEIMELISW